MWENRTRSWQQERARVASGRDSLWFLSGLFPFISGFKTYLLADQIHFYIELKFCYHRTVEHNEKFGTIMSKISDKMLPICNTFGGKYNHGEKVTSSNHVSTRKMFRLNVGNIVFFKIE